MQTAIHTTDEPVRLRKRIALLTLLVFAALC